MLGLLNKRKNTCVVCIWHVAIMFICVYLDVYGCTRVAASQVLMYIRRSIFTPSEFPFFASFLLFLIQRPNCLSRCSVCSMNARIRAPCTYVMSLSCLFAFTWTYGCTRVAASQVLIYIRKSIFTPPEFPLFTFFLLSDQTA